MACENAAFYIVKHKTITKEIVKILKEYYKNNNADSYILLLKSFVISRLIRYKDNFKE